MKINLKRFASAALSAAMVFSSLGINTAFAEEISEETEKEAVYETEDEVLSGSAVEEAPVEETSAEEASEAEADVSAEEDKIETEDFDNADLSLLPLTEVRAKLNLSDKMPVELKSIKVSEILSNLTTTSGVPIEIDENAVTVWSNFTDDDGDFVYDIWEKHGLGDTVSFYIDDNYISTIQLIVGSGNQLDLTNIRYIVSVEYTFLDDLFDFGLYVQYKDGNGSSSVTERKELATKTYLYDSIIRLGYSSVFKDYESYDDCFLSMTLNSQFSDVDMKVYEGTYETVSEVNKAAAADSSIDLTSKLVVEDMSVIDAGYKDDWLDYSYSDIKYLTVVYSRNGSEYIENIGLRVAAYDWYVDFEGPYTEDGDYICEEYEYDISYIDKAGDYAETIVYELESGYSADAEYYFYLEGNYYDYDMDYSYGTDFITRVVEGYCSYEEASSKTDIKDKLEYGDYKANFSGDGAGFTIVVGESVYYYCVKVVKYGTLSDSYYYSSDFDMPTVGSADRYFRVSGLKSGDTVLDTYVMSYDVDSYYSNGYQTILVNDTEADMTEVAPYISLSEDASLYYNGIKVETDSETSYQYIAPQSFVNTSSDPDSTPDNCVKYTVAAENHVNQRNYWITAVKKTEGAKLFVNGPDEREIFLDDYYDNIHDIFIANIGTEELTGISASLENAQNVKLDDYWTVGGEGNDTLSAFESTYTSGTYYDEIPNVAKIRLVPDGEGDISGTLRISADGQADKVIKLTGVAGNPKIDTDSLHDGVKYVPYSSIVTTNNKHDWNQAEFSLYSGELPEGVELKESGEIYGVPKETGVFNIKVKATFSSGYFSPAYADLTLTIKENTDENVASQIDEGFEIIEYIEDYTLSEGETAEEQVFEFEYDYGEHYEEFQDMWLDGEKLVSGVDYDIDKGSTKVTVKSATLTNAGYGNHTIAAEYRNTSNELKKSAQNFTKNSTGSSGGGSGSGSSGSGSSGSGGGGGGGSAKATVYTVTYETNGGSAVASQSIKKGSKITWLATPEKPGYSFAGWYTDEELTEEYDINTVVKGSFTLYAKYEQIECTVWFESNGGTVVNSITVMGDTAVETLPSSEKDGYVFGGWYTDEALTNKFEDGSKVVGNMTLYAKWDLFIPDEAPEDASGFVDVDTEAWYYSDVYWAYDKGLMVGYNNAEFAPDVTLKGSNILVVMSKLSGDDMTGFESEETEAWYAPYVRWASNAGIVGGDFKPDSIISREDAAVAIVKFMDYIKSDYSVTDEYNEFDDEALISEGAKESIQILYKLGIMCGRGNNLIDPKSTLTRAEFAALIHRMEA